MASVEQSSMAAEAVIGVARERAQGERRVALTPETCRKLRAAGARVRIERGLGDSAYFSDDAYADAGAELVSDSATALLDAALVLCVQPPAAHSIVAMKPGASLVGILQPEADTERAQALQTRGIVAFPLERLPRTTRAQAMDVLSS